MSRADFLWEDNRASEVCIPPIRPGISGGSSPKPDSVGSPTGSPSSSQNFAPSLNPENRQRLAGKAPNPFRRLRLVESIPVRADPIELRNFAMRYTAAWCSQNPESVAVFYSLQGSLRVNDGPPAVGRKAITQVAQSFMTAFPDLCLIMDDLRLQADEPEYHWTLSGMNTGPKGTGHRVRIRGFERWRIGSDGLIASSQGHFDTAEYRRQLGQGI
jgi:hypothetical protein